MIMRIKRVCIIGLVWLSWLCVCTEFPVGRPKLRTPNRDVRGQVLLDDGSNPEGIYVWLEGLNLGTRTGSDGTFRLTIPRTEGIGFDKGYSGVYRLYFYVANYSLGIAEIVLYKGDVLTSAGDLDGDGRLLGTRTLRKLLLVTTAVDPNSVAMNFTGIININVSLQAVHDSVSVYLPKIIGGHSGAVILRKTESGETFTDITVTADTTSNIERIGPEPRVFSMAFVFKRGSIGPGQYEVIPFIFIDEQPVPEKLLLSIDPHHGEIGPGYLDIPFRRGGGDLVVRHAE